MTTSEKMIDFNPCDQQEKLFAYLTKKRDEKIIQCGKLVNGMRKYIGLAEGDIVDKATVASDQELILKDIKRLQDDISKIEGLISQIQKGWDCTCILCGEKIPISHIKIVYTMLCMECVE